MLNISQHACFRVSIEARTYIRPGLNYNGVNYNKEDENVRLDGRTPIHWKRRGSYASSLVTDQQFYLNSRLLTVCLIESWLRYILARLRIVNRTCSVVCIERTTPYGLLIRMACIRDRGVKINTGPASKLCRRDQNTIPSK